MTRRRLIPGFAFAVLLVASTIGVVLAQGGQLGGKFITGNDVTIPAGETVDHDLYVFAGTVTVNGTVNGDVVAAGGNVDVNGTVNGDVLAAGGRIGIPGRVTGDVRAAGGQITIGGDVSEDVLATGGQTTVSGSVGQDLIVSGGSLTLSGNVAGSTAGSVGTYSKTGSVAGTDGITVTGNQASGFTPPPSNPVLDAIRQFIIVFVVAVLALWLAPRVMRAAEGWVRERPLPSAGWGLVAFVGYFVAIILIIVVAILLALIFAALGFGSLLGIDIFGAFVAICALTLALVVVSAFLGDAIVGLAIGRLIAGQTGRRVSPEGWSLRGADRWSDLGLIALGVAIVVVLTSVPVIGWLVKLAVVLLALGALWLVWRQRRGPGPVSVAPETAGVPPAPPPATPAAG